MTIIPSDLKEYELFIDKELQYRRALRVENGRYYSPTKTPPELTSPISHSEDDSINDFVTIHQRDSHQSHIQKEKEKEKENGPIVSPVKFKQSQISLHELFNSSITEDTIPIEVSEKMAKQIKNEKFQIEDSIAITDQDETDQSIENCSTIESKEKDDSGISSGSTRGKRNGSFQFFKSDSSSPSHTRRLSIGHDSDSSPRDVLSILLSQRLMAKRKGKERRMHFPLLFLILLIFLIYFSFY